jgi:deoxyhypusine synthase
MTVSSFMRRHYRHFNAGTLVRAAEAYVEHVRAGGKMVISLAGAMSTAQLGISLAEMIRAGYVHAVSCTGANLEEDVFNLVARDDYVPVPRWRELSREDEAALSARELNRVTDVCIPDRAFTLVEQVLVDEWRAAVGRDGSGPRFPHEYLYSVLLSGRLEEHYQIDPRESWLLAAAAADLPMVVPGWEDSTLGAYFAARVMRGEVSPSVVRSGVEYLTEFGAWYLREAGRITVPAPPDASGEVEVGSVGFLQIGGGIAGDFAISAVPTVRELAGHPEAPFWGYFCQVSDAPASYGGYSGAPPTEKITWGKLSPSTPSFVVESDATIVAPLLFAYVLGW